MIITVIMRAGRWMFPFRIIIFVRVRRGLLDYLLKKRSSLNRLYHWQSTSPYYTGGESEKECVGSKVNERRCKDKGKSEKHEKQTRREREREKKGKGEKVRDVEREKELACALQWLLN